MLGIENRGTDATGFVAVDEDGSLVLDKDAIKASDFIKVRKALPPRARTVLVHTRLATQGEPENFLNNHPVNYGTVFVTHNGTIRNDRSIFDDLSLERHAEVDSEAIAAALSFHGLEHYADALESLTGGFAIAALDANEPGKLILAKGPSWPLVIHENQQFIMWASTRETMQAAWEAVMGTRNADVTLDYLSLSEGDVVTIDDDKVEVIEKGFKSGYSWTGGGTHSTPHQWDWWEDEDNDYAHWRHHGVDNRASAYSNAATRTVIEDRSKEVKALRDAGKGIAILWDHRNEMSERDKRLHTGKWLTCPSCRETVAEMDMVDTMIWGRICLDCREVASNGGRMLFTKVQLEKSDVDDLERFAKLERDLTRQSILKVGKQSGLDPIAIEYLLFRVEDGYLDNNPKVKELRDELNIMFIDAEAEVWDAFAEDFEDQEQASSKTVKIAHTDGTIHDADKSCDQCEQNEGEACGVQVTATTPPATYTCHTCGEKLDRGRGQYHKCEFKTAETNGKKSDRCMTGKCRKRAKVHRGLLFRWCVQHHDKCATRRCRENTVASSLDGKRYCHKHSRGRKGLVFDNDREALDRATKELGLGQAAVL